MIDESGASPAPRVTIICNSFARRVFHVRLTALNLFVNETRARSNYIVVAAVAVVVLVHLSEVNAIKLYNSPEAV